ncbi:predicted protein [Chaetoceros tenuissimus]|uniref:Uncharacterized protein n=1 Tax=Chaetoceros tenuissimus TaxID=426638 RepID=A0AAD3D3C3_9STRA|nr:predicted protein [Chaetoceros tenuissimus]
MEETQKSQINSCYLDYSCATYDDASIIYGQCYWGKDENRKKNDNCPPKLNGDGVCVVLNRGITRYCTNGDWEKLEKVWIFESTSSKAKRIGEEIILKSSSL